MFIIFLVVNEIQKNGNLLIVTKKVNKCFTMLLWT